MKTVRFWLRNYWPVLVFVSVTILFFWKFFFRGLLPIPADIIVGTYLPWFDLVFRDFPAGVPVKNNVLSDVVSIMYPWRMFAIDLMKSGVAPLWNPHILSGNVLLANFQSAPFYPLNIIYWLISDFPTAWSLQVILQPLLGTLFMYLFLTHNGFLKSPAVYGSLIWGFSGFFMVWLEYNTIVHASIYFPLILYSIQKGIKDNKYLILLSLSISFSFYAGYPQITLYVLMSSLIFLLTVVPRQRLKKYLLLAAFALLGVGLSLPFLMPGYEMVGNSIRQVDEVANMSNVKYVLPTQVITFIAPDYFGNPASRNYWLKGTYENAVIFASVPAFLLFLTSFFIGKKHKHKLLIYSWMMFLIACFFAFKNPASEFIGNSRVLLFSSSVMGRLAVIITFALALSSAVVLDLILKGKIKLTNITFSLITVCLLLVFYGAGAITSENSVAIRNLIFPAFVFVVTSALVIGSIKYSKLRRLAVVLIFLITIIDLYRFHNKYNSFSPREFLYPKTGITDYLATQAPERFESGDGPIMPSNMWMPMGLYSASGQDAVHTLRYNKFLQFLNTGKLKTADRYTRISNYDSTLFDFLGISNIVAVRQKNGSPDFEGVPGDKFDNPKFMRVFDEGRTTILENSNSYPRIFSVGGYMRANGDWEFEDLLRDIDLRETVILEEDLGMDEFSRNISIGSEKFEVSETSVRTKSEGDGLLVFVQSHLPGWKGFVDGEEVPVYRANYAFMALVIPSGDHEVSLRYQPDSFKWGIYGGLFSLGVLLVSALYIIFRKHLFVSFPIQD